MADAHKNFAYSLVATAPSPATSGTSLVVTAGQGALFPTPPFNATIWPTGVQPISTNAEIVRVTNISTDTLTITRAQESSSARTVIMGDQIAATITKLTFDDYVAKSGDTMTGDLIISSSTSGNKKLVLSSFFETDSIGTTELITLHNSTPANLNGNSAKAAIAFFEDDVSTSQSKAWVQTHNYLNYYNPVTFLPTAVNTSTGVITLAAQTDPYVDAYQVQFSTTGTLPSGLAAATNYYIHKLTSTTFSIFNDAALSSQVTLTTQGTGTHTITPNNDYASTDGSIFNKHQHFSIEVSEADGFTKTSRFSIPYDYDTTEISTFSANFNVNAGISRIVGAANSDKQLQFGNPPTPNPRVPDGTNIRWILKQDNTSESGSSVGSDFRIVPANDSGVAQASVLFIKRSTGNIGLGTNAPTSTLTLPSTSTGIALYNTSDQTTNFERVNIQWTGSAFTIYSGNGGTGVERNIQIGDSTTSFNYVPGASSGSPKFTLTRSSGTSGSLFEISATGGLTGGAGILQYGLKIDPTINQTSTAAYTVLLVNPSETAVGSGAKLLADFQVGGTSKVSIKNDGVIFPVQAATASAPTYVKGGIYFDTTLNKLRVGGATAWETITSS